MFNEEIFAAMLGAAIGISIGLEFFKKTYLEQVFGKFSWYAARKPIIIRVVAFGIAAVTVLSSSSDLSFFHLFGRQPSNLIAEITNFALTSLVLSFGEEALHNLGDVYRMFINTKRNLNV